jgi:hypothetical protein
MDKTDGVTTISKERMRSFVHVPKVARTKVLRRIIPKD